AYNALGKRKVTHFACPLPGLATEQRLGPGHGCPLGVVRFHFCNDEGCPDPSGFRPGPFPAHKGGFSMKRWSVVTVALLLGLAIGTFGANSFLHGQSGQPAAPLPKELTSFRDVVKTVVPAVVSIESKAKVVKTKGGQSRPAPFDRNQIPEEFRRFFD